MVRGMQLVGVLVGSCDQFVAGTKDEGPFRCDRAGPGPMSNHIGIECSMNGVRRANESCQIRCRGSTLFLSCLKLLTASATAEFGTSTMTSTLPSVVPLPG